MNPAPLFDILRLFFTALFSMLRQPGRLPRRSWRTELAFRFIKSLADTSKGKPIPWLRQRQKLLKLYTPDFSKVAFEAQTLAGVPVQYCRPKSPEQRQGIVIFFHGGGYVVGSVNGYRNTLAALAVASDCQVIGVDYRLAPEHPFPAAHDDCLAVSRHILQAHPQARVVLAGDSAGGALAIASALALATEGATPLPSGLALISPWVDPCASQGSVATNADSDILDADILTDWRERYLAGSSPANGRINFSSEDLSALPPSYIQAAGAEILLDQIEAFTERAKRSGVDITLDIYPDQFHVFQTFSPLVDGSRAALNRLGEFIGTRVGG
jgi:acetyl esterase/lipase